MVARAVPVFLALLMTVALFAGCFSAGPASTDDDGGVTKVTGQRGPPVTPGEYKFDADFSQVLALGPYTEEVPMEWAIIPSPVDGAEVHIAVWRPKVPEGVTVPVIVDAGPYFPPDLTTARTAGNHLGRLAHNFMSHGYAIAALVVRGTADGGGCMDLMGNKERADLDAGITWLGQQSWSNGKVAMIGASYDGSTPFEVASWGNEHLATIVPVSGLTDIYGLMYRNGTAEVRGPIVLNALYYMFSMGLPLANPDRSAEKRIEGTACPESIVGIGVSASAGAGLGRDPAGWWDERDSRPGLVSNYKGSILHIHGLQDWNVDPALNIPWIDTTLNRTANVPLHQWLGQWGHAFPDSSCHSNTRQNNPDAFRNCRYDWHQYLLQWFDYWLKDIRTIDLGPPVQVQDHDRSWRGEEHWPPRDATPVSFELSMPARLVPLGEAQAGVVRLQPNPTGETGNDAKSTLLGQPYAEFSTGVLEQDTLISGLPKVHVTVSPEGPGGTLSAWLYRKSPAGLERIGWTSMNLLYADGSEQPTPVVPNQEIVARLQIQPMDAMVPAGNELVLRLWGYPPTDRIHNTVGGSINLVLGAQKSTLEIPTIQRDASVYFDVPFPTSKEATASASATT